MMKDSLRGTVTQKDWMFVGAVLAIAVVIGAAFYFLVHKKKQVEMAAVDTLIAEKNDQLKVAIETAKKMEEDPDGGPGEFEREAQKMKELVESFNNRLPEEREIPQMVGQFEAKANEIGLVSVELRPMDPIIDQNKETFPHEITAQGTFHEILSFINLLEKNQTYLKISDIDIGEEKDGVSEASFTMSTFRFIGDTEEAQ